MTKNPSPEGLQVILVVQRICDVCKDPIDRFSNAVMERKDWEGDMTNTPGRRFWHTRCFPKWLKTIP